MKERDYVSFFDSSDTSSIQSNPTEQFLQKNPTTLQMTKYLQNSKTLRFSDKLKVLSEIELKLDTDRQIVIGRKYIPTLKNLLKEENSKRVTDTIKKIIKKINRYKKPNLAKISQENEYSF